MEQPQIVHCKDCVFYERFRTGQTFLGYCHRNAPSTLPNAVGTALHAAFPIIKYTSFCGEGELPEFPGPDSQNAVEVTSIQGEEYGR